MKINSLLKIFFIIFPINFSFTEQKIVTIWVHGTMIPRVPQAIRESHFHRNFGLAPIDDYLQNRTSTSNAPLSLINIANTLHNSMPSAFMLEDYYVFGWSAKPSFSEREIAGNHLYTDLINLKKKYISLYGDIPFIRIISHSHGGNVVLNLAPLCKDNQDFYIDEIILLACPVQEKTAAFIKAPCFKEVYAFYSDADIIQIIDPQGLYPENRDTKSIFSKRKFEGLSNFYQAQIKINNRSLGHMDFISARFLCYLPELCIQTKEFDESIILNQKDYTKTVDIHIHKNQPVQFLRKLKQ
jgi:hypothetical protein